MSIAGHPLLRELGVPFHQLQPSPKIVTHVAVKLLGSLPCWVMVDMNTTPVHVYFAEGMQHLYLSGAWKALQQLPNCPATAPYEFVKENVERLKKWLLEYFGHTVFVHPYQR